MSDANDSMTYRDSGVDIDEGNRFVAKIKSLMAQKIRPENLSGIGSFGGLFDISALTEKKPVLVTSIDGVGTKLEVARMANNHKTVGVDIVSHCVNDILVQGAKPLFFTDYLGCGSLDASVLSDVVEGIVTTCKEANCELMGGETAEMPGMYKKGDYDLVGSITGVVDKDKIITGEKIAPGDMLIALPSSGLHTNGYSLARKIVFEKMKFTVDTKPDGFDCSIGEALLKPHRLYSSLAYKLFDAFTVKGMAHITGGGLTENLPRIFPENIQAVIDTKAFEVPLIFKSLMQWGNVAIDEMYRVFNMGVGMVIIVSADEADDCLKASREDYPESQIIGEITALSGSEKVVYKY